MEPRTSQLQQRNHRGSCSADAGGGGGGLSRKAGSVGRSVYEEGGRGESTLLRQRFGGKLLPEGTSENAPSSFGMID